MIPISLCVIPIFLCQPHSPMIPISLWQQDLHLLYNYNLMSFVWGGMYNICTMLVLKKFQSSGGALAPPPSAPSPVWYIHSNTCFQFLNNITCIFIHFFTDTYFYTCFQFLSACTKHLLVSMSVGSACSRLEAGPHLESHSPSSFRIMMVPLLFLIVSPLPLIVYTLLHFLSLSLALHSLLLPSLSISLSPSLPLPLPLPDLHY